MRQHLIEAIDELAQFVLPVPVRSQTVILSRGHEFGGLCQIEYGFGDDALKRRREQKSQGKRRTHEDHDHPGVMCQPLAHFENGHLLVHAGVVPQWSAQQTLAYAHEVESVLRGPDWVDFLREMYGNAPDTWDDGLAGVDRLRCIVNVLTRIRFCTPEGKMEFTAKGGIDAAPPGYLPWFDVPGRRTEDVTVVFGHWSALGLLMRPNLIGLDTGCIWGGKLTAVCLDDRSVLQVDCAALPA